ncbi:SH3 domain-containing protein [Microbacterium sp.]|uniref:SH3 domain-containing protein n=1 Tax=Microbacterium sp. TaxID=51671 RepID=UPI003A87D287
MHPSVNPRRMLPAGVTLVVGALLAGLLSFATPAPARAAELPGSILEGGYIISDAAFFDSDALSAGQIQSFLNARVPTCRATSGPPCLKDFVTDLPAKAADRYCSSVARRDDATAAEVISAVAAACGISPKVILVMLQKEQGLVTSTAPSNWSYRAAMGQACPDTAPCDAAAAGFVNQVYLGARQLQVYTKNPTWFSYRAGQVNTIKWHPNNACGSSRVYIQNQATANLYIYTPYRANVAALAAGWASGDSCSAYGNRNFYNYYVAWFAPGASSSSGAPAQIPACTVPASGDIAAASGTRTVTRSTTRRTAPTFVCDTGSSSLSAGATVTATGTYGAWTRATSGGKTVWVLSNALSGATTGTGAGDSCAVPSSSSISAASGTAVVATDRLNARKAPTTACTTGVVQIARGEKYTRTGTYGSWWRLEIGGASYWSHSDYLSLESTPTPAPAPTVKGTPITPVTREMNETATLRVAPSPDADAVMELTTGTKVRATATSGSWRFVHRGSRSGWLPASTIRRVQPTVSVLMRVTDDLNLRSAASTTGTVLALLAPRRLVIVEAGSGGWRMIRSGSLQGWVARSYLEPVTAVTTTNLNLRTSPTTSSRVQTVVPKGTTVTVRERSGVWRKVIVGSRTGWMAATYLR